MTGETSRPDGIALAVAVRALASDVQRFQGRASTPPHERAALAGRIHHLRASMPPTAVSPLSRWLESLERELDLN